MRAAHPINRVLVAILLLVISHGSILQAALTPVEELTQRAQREIEIGNLREATLLLQEALQLESAENPARAERLLLLSRVHVNLGEYRLGLDMSRRALSIYETINDPIGLAEAHLRTGAAHDELAEYSDARHHFHLALDLARQNDDRMQEATVLSALGTSHRFLGEPETALRSFEQALAIFEELDQKPSICFSRRSMGTVYEDLGRFTDAEEQYRSALDLLDTWDWPWGEADLLFHLGRLGARLGRAGSRTDLERALRQARVAQNRWTEAQAGIELARVRLAEGDAQLALELGRAGVELLQDMGAADLEWEARYVLASILEVTSTPEVALKEYERAAQILESIRSSIGLPTARAHYSPRGCQVYDAVLRLRSRGIDQSEGDLAFSLFALAERGRARALMELLAESRIDPGAGASALRGEEKNLRAQIAALRTTLSRFAWSVSDPQVLEEELFNAERAHEAVLEEIRRQDPRYEEYIQPRPIQSEEIASLLGNRTDLLSYHLGERSSLGWYMNQQELVVFELPPARAIENLVLMFNSLTKHSNDDQALLELAQTLHEILLGPISDRLDSERSLVIIPDKALFRLPFELLGPKVEGTSGFIPLVKRHAISYLPSISVLRELRGRAELPAPGVRYDWLAFADPWQSQSGAEPRLAGAAAETDRIGSRIAASRRLQFTGDTATESAFRRSLKEPVRILHLATHGIVDEERVEQSGLVFATEQSETGDGFLTLAEVYDLNLSVELVVLSACETAGGKLLRGEGVEGLARAFLFAGSRVVVASLWDVDDRATEELMVSFYKSLQDGDSVAEALRHAKLETMNSRSSTASPNAWAAFILIGDGETRITLSSSSDYSTLLLTIGILFCLCSATMWLVTFIRRPSG